MRVRQLRRRLLVQTRPPPYSGPHLSISSLFLQLVSVFRLCTNQASRSGSAQPTPLGAEVELSAVMVLRQAEKQS